LLYEKVSFILNDRPDFLYNYAAELNAAGHFIESDKLTSRCAYLLNDYDTELLAADNHMAMEQWEDALPHLQTAMHMVPSRFMPLYGVMQVYDALGERQKACAVAKSILHKPVKIASPEVGGIKHAAHRFLDKSQQAN